MNVELPSSGCNIINSSTTFYNYSADSKTRESYVIYEGKAFLQSSSYNQYGYSYSGTCLVTGDLVYQPQLKEVFFPILSIGCFLFILWVAYTITLKRWWRRI